jgi:hypothetical protein
MVSSTMPSVLCSPHSGPSQPLDDGRAQAEDERDERRRDDRDSRGAGSQRRAPKAVARLVRLALDQNDQVTQVARRLGQPSLAEAREDAAFEMRNGSSDVVNGQLDLVAGRAGTCHVMTVGVPTATAT